MAERNKEMEDMIDRFKEVRKKEGNTRKCACSMEGPVVETKAEYLKMYELWISLSAALFSMEAGG